MLTTHNWLDDNYKDYTCSISTAIEWQVSTCPLTFPWQNKVVCTQD